MDNKCVVEKRFTCGTHSQRECRFFKQCETCPTILCKWGQPDYDCHSRTANIHVDIQTVAEKLKEVNNEK
jgi:hypothetical protein